MSLRTPEGLSNEATKGLTMGELLQEVFKAVGPPGPAGDLKLFLKKLSHVGRSTVNRSQILTHTQAAGVSPNIPEAGNWRCLLCRH